MPAEVPLRQLRWSPPSARYSTSSHRLRSVRWLPLPSATLVQKSRLRGRGKLSPDGPQRRCQNLVAARHTTPRPRRLWPEGLRQDRRLSQGLRRDSCPGRSADRPRGAASRSPLYWLAETARQAGKWDEAETYYSRVTQHPDAGDLLAATWWRLGEVQSQRKEWPAAVASYEKYRQLKPEARDATIVILADGRAQLGAQNLDVAKKLGEQALTQEPEGPNSAAARMLLGETAFAAQNYPEAARMFGTLAVLFDDPKITPQAMARAADAFEKAGDAKSAADWRQKLKIKYPQYTSSPFL